MNEASVAIRERITQCRERIGTLGEKGLDLSKVETILGNLESKLDDTPDEKLEPALVKLEEYLDKMESKISKKVVRKVKVKRMMKEEAPDPQSSEKEGSGVSDDPQEETPPTDEAPEAPPPDPEGATKEEGEVPEQDIETKQEVPEPEHEEIQEEAPAQDDEGSQQPEETPPFDEDTAREQVRALREQIKEIGELEGDPSGISSHMESLESAFAKSDKPTYDQFLPIVTDWVEGYLASLRKGKINTLSDSIQVMVDIFVAFDKGSEVEGIPDRIDDQITGLDGSDLESLKEKIDSLLKIHSELEKGYTRLKKEAGKTLKGRMKELEGKIKSIEDEIDAGEYRKFIEMAREAIENEEYLISTSNLDELDRMIDGHINSGKMKKMETILLSIEPMLQKVMEARGESNDDYHQLLDEKNRIVERSGSDIDGALVDVEELLDKASILVADIEEKRVEILEASIREEKEKASELASVMETGPVINIIEKAEGMLQEGTIDKASEMMDRAIAAFDNLKRKKEMEETKEKLKRYEARSKDYSELGLDTTPLNEPLTNAWNALDSDDKEALAGYIDDVESKLSYLRIEELKLKYQKILIKIINSLKELREKGEDVTELEKSFDGLKSLYMDRKFEEAIETATELENKLSQLKLSDVLDDRFAKVKETITEAEGLMVDVSGPKQRIDEAEELRKNGNFSESLDILVEVQVEIDDMMTQRTFSFIEKEIKDLVSECSTYSLDPGDTETIMNQAYGLADDEKYRDAMDLLTGFRDKLSKKLLHKKVDSLLTQLGSRIKEARPLKINVSSYKASQTKAKVLLDAGEVEKAFELVQQRTEELGDEIKGRRQTRSKLDQLRGRLLAQEGKLSRLSKDGTDIGDMDMKVSEIRDFIEGVMPDEAEKAINELETRINDLLRKRPEQMKKEMINTIVDRKEEIKPRPITIAKKEPEPEPVTEPPKEQEKVETTPEKARSELFILIPKIKAEKTRLNSKGIDTDTYNDVIASIQKLVMERKYIDALIMARGCYKSMTQ